MQTYKAVWLHSDDNVATALERIPEQADVDVAVDGVTLKIRIAESIEFGHKFAVREIEAGGDIRKYGQVIGAAVRTIAAGEHVHVHNLEGKRGRGDRHDGNDDEPN